MISGLAICSVYALRPAVMRWWPDCVVSVCNPGWQPPLVSVPQFAMQCHDIEVEADIGPKGQIRRGPNAGQVRTFIDFLPPREGRLLIQCTAGLSRSPALATVAMVVMGHSPLDACAAVRRTVPQASPNRRILEMADALMGTSLRAAADQTFTYCRGPNGAVGEAISLAVITPDDQPQPAHHDGAQTAHEAGRQP